MIVLLVQCVIITNLLCSSVMLGKVTANVGSSTKSMKSLVKHICSYDKRNIQRMFSLYCE